MVTSTAFLASHKDELHIKTSALCKGPTIRCRNQHEGSTAP
ncbi:hypothetical protein VCHENC02_2146 [Vibrio harveyi]|uniref:Uncharacterized protein n=1 Tax=Vibrio harveyi TaxID=669 RepID=A0A454D0T6_VIBHA|nr:hypothetical protein VCHENC02_2146 [Vibrio harveyi]